MFSRQLFRLNINSARRCLQVQNRVNINKVVLSRCSSADKVFPSGVKLKNADDDSESVYLYSRRDVDVDDPVLLDARTQVELSEMREKLQKQQSYIPEDFLYFNLQPSTIQKLNKHKIEKLFPVQHESFKHIIDGHDVVVQARTGTGKTLAFVLPLLESLQSVEGGRERGRAPVILGLEPTRELAIQTCNEFKKFKAGDINVGCFYGGTSYNVQESHLRDGMDVLIGTPGRILDHVKSGRLDLSQIKHVVLDEADRMLGMGFQEEIDEILSYSYTKENKPQTLLFSATMPTWIKKMASKYMEGDVKIVDLIGDDVMKAATTVQHKAIRCQYHERPSTLNKIVKFYCGSEGRAIIFTQTKREASELVHSGVLTMGAEAIHGDRSQRERENTLNAFRTGKVKCLVATDVASRGLDIPEVDLVIQTEPPMDLDNYIHRSGRTGRAGNEGLSVICFDKRSQYHQLLDVQKRAGIKFKQIYAPTVNDLLESAMAEASRTFQEMETSVADRFRGLAKDLMKEEKYEHLVVDVLSIVSGTTKLVKGSRLASMMDINNDVASVKTGLDDSERCLEESDPYALDMLLGPAKELIKKDNHEEEIAAALALISRSFKKKRKSLLTSRTGYTALSISLKHRAHKIGHFWWMLKANFDPDLIENVKPLRMCADRMGCVFDVPASVAEELLNSWPSKNLGGSLTVATQLPLLEEAANFSFTRNNGNLDNDPSQNFEHKKPYGTRRYEERNYDTREKYNRQRNDDSRQNYRSKRDNETRKYYRKDDPDDWEF